ncbi:MAG: SdpI family protein [Deltaproteobacteria bacterium]|nr:SdpI family protein [Deltaproteobacteria bacterium]
MPYLFIAAGLLFILISIPLILGKVGPNNFYGFRTKKTMADRKIWFAANKVMGIDLVVAGLAIVAGSIIIMVVAPEDRTQVAYVELAIFACSLLAAVVHSIVALRRM